MGNIISSAAQAIANTFRRIAPPIVRYVVQHPMRTVFHVANGVLLLVPGAVTAPLLAVAGFARGGVVAGSYTKVYSTVQDGC
jgi:hypothetical protein